MPKKVFALAKDQPSTIEIEWRGLWKDIRVRKDGQELGSIANQRELQAGKSFVLGDGSTLRVQLIRDFGNVRLDVTRNGQPLPGSSGDPAVGHKSAYGVVFFIAGLNVVLGIVGTLFSNRTLQSLGIGWPLIVMGAIFGVLGWFIWQKKSLIALGIAIAIFGLDGLVTLVMAAMASGRPPVGAVIFRIFIIVIMARGFKAMRDLKKEAQAAPSIASFD